MKCVYCKSRHAVRNGVKKNGLQNYKCIACNRQFTAKTWKGLCRLRHSPQSVLSALMLKFKGRQSLREIVYWLKEFFQIKISHVAIYNWILKFASLFDKLAKCHTIQFTKVWHVDEKFIKVRGSKDRHAYLWVVEDSKSNIVAVYVSNRRDIVSAKTVLKLARENSGFESEVLVTDGCQVYKRACRIFGRKCKHVTAHFKAEPLIWKGHSYWLSNNIIERLNSTIELFKHVMRGFKSLLTANIWMKMFAIFYNYLRP